MFSVIIPTFNRLSFLSKAIETVLSQTCGDYELIIIDDGSNDGTKKYCAAINDERLIYLYQNNRGVAHARNRGLELAKGEWIAFLDSDDRWLPNKLERVKVYIKQYSDILIFHTEEKWFRDDVIHNPKKVHKKPTGFVYENALPLCCISISTAVIHRKVFDDVGIFDESLPACEDYDFWLRATYKYEVKLIEEYLSEKEGGRPDQLSSQWGLDRWRVKSLAKMVESGILDKHHYAATLKVLRKKADVYIKGAEKRGKMDEVAQLNQLLHRIVK